MDKQDFISKLSEKRYCERLLNDIFLYWLEGAVVIYSKELYETVLKTVASLPEEEARAMELLCRDGKSKEEIAQILGLDKNKTTILLAKAHRDMCHPSRSRNFRPFLIELEDDLSAPADSTK